MIKFFDETCEKMIASRADMIALIDEESTQAPGKLCKDYKALGGPRRAPTSLRVANRWLVNVVTISRSGRPFQFAASLNHVYWRYVKLLSDLGQPI